MLQLRFRAAPAIRSIACSSMLQKALHAFTIPLRRSIWLAAWLAG